MTSLLGAGWRVCFPRLRTRSRQPVGPSDERQPGRARSFDSLQFAETCTDRKATSAVTTNPKRGRDMAQENCAHKGATIHTDEHGHRTI